MPKLISYFSFLNMIFQTNIEKMIMASKRLVDSQTKQRQLRLREVLAKQHFHYDTSEVYETKSKSNRDTSKNNMNNLRPKLKQFRILFNLHLHKKTWLRLEVQQLWKHKILIEMTEKKYTDQINDEEDGICFGTDKEME